MASIGLEIEGKVLVGIGTCSDKDIIIPPTYNDKPVISIGSEAFRNCESLTSLILPESITKHKVIKNRKKSSKNSFISDILNDFMKHNIALKQAICCEGSLYLLLDYEGCDLNCTNMQKLFLYGNYANINFTSVKSICKNKKIRIKVVTLPGPTEKSVVYFFGKITNEFINQIISCLENENTSKI